MRGGLLLRLVLPAARLGVGDRVRKRPARDTVKLLLTSEFHVSLFVSFGGNLPHGKSIQ